jgi:TusA-related sulfurtransferase
MAEIVDYDEEVDVSDKIDPFPGIIVRDILDKMVAGHVLKVSTNSKKTVEILKRQLSKSKCEWLSVDEYNDKYFIFLERIN